jgi:hypothetical protein
VNVNSEQKSKSVATFVATSCGRVWLPASVSATHGVELPTSDGALAVS